MGLDMRKQEKKGIVSYSNKTYSKVMILQITGLIVERKQF